MAGSGWRPDSGSKIYYFTSGDPTENTCDLSGIGSGHQKRTAGEICTDLYGTEAVSYTHLHGTISLIEEGTLVTAILTQKELYKKSISNIVEVRTRGAFVLAITNEGRCV